VKQILQVIIILVTLLALIYWWYNPNIRDAFLNFNIVSLPIIYFYYLLFYGLNALAVLVIARKSSKEIGFLQIFGISQFSSLIGYALPLRIAHIGVRAAYLKHRFKIPYGETIGGGIIATLMSMSVSGIILLLFGLNYLKSITDGQYSLLITLLVSLVALSIALYRYKHSISGYITTRFPKFGSLKRGITQLSSTDLALLLALTASALVVTAVINQTLINGIGMDASFSICLLLAAAGTVSFIVALTPANLGTKELVYIGIGALYGLAAEKIFAFLIIDRIVQITFLSISSAVFYFNSDRSRSLLSMSEK